MEGKMLMSFWSICSKAGKAGELKKWFISVFNI